MFCKFCGKVISDDANACSFCGKSQKADGQPTIIINNTNTNTNTNAGGYVGYGRVMVD